MIGGELDRVVNGDATPHDAVAVLSRQLRDRPGSVLVLEDLHWADEATLDVLRLLARRIDTVPVLVVATYRDDQLDRDHPLRLVLGELTAGAALRRVSLSPLSREAVGQLAEPYSVDADQLYAKTSGNPFFVLEALASGGAAIPDTVRDAVLARASQLNDRGPHACSRPLRSSRRWPRSGCSSRWPARRSRASTQPCRPAC